MSEYVFTLRNVRKAHGDKVVLDNVTLSCILSLCAQHHMPTGTVPGYVEVIANRDAYNPVADWIRSRA